MNSFATKMGFAKISDVPCIKPFHAVALAMAREGVEDEKEAWRKGVIANRKKIEDAGGTLETAGT